MLWSLRPTDTDVELSAHTKETLKRLERETEIVSWSENGGLFFACNEERLREYKRMSEMGEYWGIESRVVSAADAVDIHPLMSPESVYGAVYSPTDGTIDPTGCVNAYAKAARSRGATILENARVAGIDVNNITTNGGRAKREVSAVRLADGRVIETSVVVNCAGAWAGKIANMVGSTIPLLPMKHAMVVTETIEGMHSGLPNVRDHDLSVYFKTQGSAMCLGGYEQNPEFIHGGLEDDFAFGLYELDWDTFAQNLEGHIKRSPAVETAGIQSTVCGPESFTPDHKALIGPDVVTNGFYYACGFNSMGMLAGGGAGREIAAWIVDGTPTLDMFSFDVSRFHESTVANAKWVQDRTHEGYSKTYAMVMPHDESLAGRGARKSHVHDELVSAGCVHQARHGFERPGWFLDSSEGSTAPLEYDYYGAYAGNDNAWRLGDDRKDDDLPAHVSHRYHDIINGELTFSWPASHEVVAAECRATRENAAIFDQSYFGKFHIDGPRAREAVQFLAGADIKEAPQTTYTVLCNELGGVEADLTITALRDGRFYVASGGNTVMKDFAWIRRAFDKGGFEDVALEDDSDDYTILSVQGPKSRQLLQAIGVDQSIEAENLPFSSCQKTLPSEDTPAFAFYV